MTTKPLETKEIKIPKSINPCPIKEAVVEIRFESLLPPEAIFGAIYNQLKSEYSKVEKLPILQLPASIIEETPTFKFKPHYQLASPNYLIRVGPRVFSIIAINNYKGWNDYSSQIFSCLETVKKMGIISHVSRLGIRYINDFGKTDIFKNIKLNVGSDTLDIPLKEASFRSEISLNDFNNILMISNQKPTSILDIDTCINFKKTENFFSNMKRLINKGHETEKHIFFSLLTDSFLKTFNPNY